MNILQQEDIIKGLPDQALQEEAKRPSGQVPQFLVVSEIQRRTDMRKRYQDPNQQQPQGTIADQITQEGIASVQPQQPMQGQQQQGQPMPMRVGGMTPFMRKYAGGGVVRMQEGGITPHEMAQMDAQMMAQKYPFLSGSRDEILQGLSTVDPNDVSYISSMFNGAPEIEAVLASRSKMPQPPMPIENITEPSLFALDGVNTLTPDGRRPNPNEPSVDTLEQFSNAFKEDAARAENLLATLDDSTAKEKEAISNPVNVNLPKIRTLDEIGREAPQMLPLSKRKAPPSLDEDQGDFLNFLDKHLTVPQKGAGAMYGDASEGGGGVPEQTVKEVYDQFSDVGQWAMENPAEAAMVGLSFNPGIRAFKWTGQAIQKMTTNPMAMKALGNVGKGLNWFNPVKVTRGSEVTRTGLMGKPYQEVVSRSISSNPLGQARLAAGIYGVDKAGDYFSGSDDPVVASANETLDRAGNEQGGDIADSQSDKPPVANGNGTVISDGANTEGSGDIGVNNFNKAVNLLNNAFALDLDETKKEAFAMAMIQLGAGIAKGDLAEGLSNAGVAASGVLERSRDRSDKQLDREIQRKYYDDKLSDSTLDRESRIRRDAGTSALKKYTAEATSPLNLAKFAKMSQAEKDQLYDTIFQEELRVLTQSATGSDMRRGGNLAESLNEDPLGLRKT